jgi:predicted transcriptional regulator
MATKAKQSKSVPKMTRASVSLPTGIYQELERLATAKKVSLAWVMRDAAEKYVADQWPLFGQDAGRTR